MCGRSTNAMQMILFLCKKEMFYRPYRCERARRSQSAPDLPIEISDRKKFSPVFKILLLVLSQFEGNIRQELFQQIVYEVIFNRFPVYEEKGVRNLKQLVSIVSIFSKCHTFFYGVFGVFCYLHYEPFTTHQYHTISPYVLKQLVLEAKAWWCLNDQSSIASYNEMQQQGTDVD